MAYNVVFLLAVLCTTYVYSLDNDDYSALFYDNKEVFVDKPIKFEYPLPSWLRGSLVRIVGYSFWYWNILAFATGSHVYLKYN